MGDSWKHSLRNRMEDFEMAEPEGLWNRIEESLPARVPFSMVPVRKKRRRGLWLGVSGGIAAGLALVLLLGRGGDMLSPVQDDYIAVVEETEQPSAAAMPDESGHEYGGTEGERAVIAVVRDAESAESDEAVIQEDVIEDVRISASEDKTSVYDVENQINEDEYAENVESSRDGKSAVKEESAENKVATETYKERFLSAEVEDVRRRRWTAGLIASNVPFGKASSSSGFQNVAPARTDAEVQAQPFGDISAFNMNRKTATSVQHYQPIRAGVMVSYSFAERWSLETGVTYSYLFSKFRSGSDSYYYRRTQSLHFVGIPLNVNFSVWKNDFLDVYLSAGGLMEKCVAGNRVTTNVYGTLTGEPQSEKVGVNPLQWSVSASAGVQYRFSPWAGIFLEPGASYYFANGSGVESAYTARPFSFNIELGLRFSF